MNDPSRYVAYYRVSTAQQGLGLDAQREAVGRHLTGARTVIAEFTEKESGKRDDRPELEKALRTCRLRHATLIVAKLDRLARNVRFLLTLVEASGERGVVFCDLPTIPEGPMGKFFITQMASVAELEAGLISKRTREALAVKKAQLAREGKRLGTPYPEKIAAYNPIATRAAAEVRTARARLRALDLRESIKDLRARGVTSYNGLARELNAIGQPAPRGGRWTAWQLSQVLRLVEEAA